MALGKHPEPDPCGLTRLRVMAGDGSIPEQRHTRGLR